MASYTSTGRCLSARRATTTTHRTRRTIVCQADGVVARCPFANFNISPAPKSAKPTPLDMLDKPYEAVADTWLEHGRPGQDTPGKLVTGMFRLYEHAQFLLEDPNLFGEQMAVKEKAFDERLDQVFVALPRSLPGQQECLELFLEYLPFTYPQLYSVEGEGDGRVVTMHFPEGGEKKYAVADFAARPLELCSRLVQEDLVLMQISEDNPGPDPKGAQHEMTAAAAVFSFTDTPQKLGKPLESLHIPVPGYEEHLRAFMNRTFTNMTADKPLWRNNWVASFTKDVTHPVFVHGGPSVSMKAFEARTGRKLTAADLYLKCEYQTLRRLPESRAILFTVRPMIIRMVDIGQEAARVLHGSLAGLTPELRAYKALPDELGDEVLALLERLAAGEKVEAPSSDAVPAAV